MKFLSIMILTLFSMSVAHAEESLIKKVDRSAQEAVDEAKRGAKIIVKKLQDSTSSTPTPDEVKKKDQKE